MKKLFSILLSFSLCLLLQAQTTAFQPVSEAAIPISEDELTLSLSHYQTFALDNALLATALLPTNGTNYRGEDIRISLPMPDGSQHSFRLIERQVLHPTAQARWPQLRTYRLVDADNPALKGSFTWTPQGSTAVWQSGAGKVYIEPYQWGNDTYHVAYYAKDAQVDLGSTAAASCGYIPTEETSHDNLPVLKNGDDEVTFRQEVVANKYRFDLALTCTGEYAQQKGGTVEAVLASFVTATNLANDVFENEVGVTVQLISRIEELIYLNPLTDPFTNSDQGGALLGQVQNAIVSRAGIPGFTYDLGHVFTSGCTDVGGVVNGSVCTGGKDRGVTCHSSNNLAAIVNRIMTHEIAHQFGVDHSWNNCPNAQAQRRGGSAYEPGSGSTIMSYAGTCGNQNVQFREDSYYHGWSVEQFNLFVRETIGPNCSSIIPTGNTVPTVSHDYNSGFFIPISTPFELTAEANDVDDDPITYCWEQFNLGNADALGTPSGDGPSFRTYSPTGNNTRVFPRLSAILNNLTDVTEVLPTYSRNFTFRCTVRDNNEEIGATATTDVIFKSTDTAGPFRVLSPNTSADRWMVGDYVEVTWDVANTDNTLVNCQNVNVKLSTDGGLTYPYLLAESVPNSGSTFITVPDAVGNNSRVRIEAAKNIFFDLSNDDFRVIPATAPTYTLDFTPNAQRLCIPASADITFNSASILGYDGTVALDIISDLPTGAEASFSTTTLTPGESVSLNVDLNNISDFEVELPVTVRAIAPDQDTFYRTFFLFLIDNDFSALVNQTPENGSRDVAFSTAFSWNAVDNAQEYDWRVSPDPTFSDVEQIQSSLTGNATSPEDFFAKNELYFWQVRGRNECGESDWSIPYVFHTIYEECTAYSPDDTPIGIPGVGPPPTIESKIVVNEAGIINDLNLPIVDVRYNPVQNFTITLISPEQTEAILYDGNCFATDRVWLGFDDEAPDSLSCPPTEGVVVRGPTPLSIFNGENTQGTWILRVKINESGFGSPGSIANWGVEFCATLTPEQPSLLVNNPLRVPPGQANPVTPELLRVEDDQPDSDLTYTLIAQPQFGQVLFQDRILEVGDQFRQSTINAGNLSYRNEDDTIDDGFYFVVEDGTGGFLPVERFNIIIDDSAVVNTDDILQGQNFVLAPNPATQMAQVRLQEPLSQSAPLQVFALDGRMLWQSVLRSGSTTLDIDVSTWPTGMYLVRLGEQSTKLMVE